MSTPTAASSGDWASLQADKHGPDAPEIVGRPAGHSRLLRGRKLAHKIRLSVSSKSSDPCVRATFSRLIQATRRAMDRRLLLVVASLPTLLTLLPADALARAGGGSHGFSGHSSGFGGGGSRGRGFGGGHHFFFFGGGGGGSFLLIILIIVVVLFLVSRRRGRGRGRRGSSGEADLVVRRSWPRAS